MISDKTIRISEIINKKIAQGVNLTKDEENLLNEWLARSEMNRSYYQNYSVEKEYAEFEGVVGLSDKREQLRRLNRRLDNRNLKRMTRRWIGYAAGIAVVVGASFAILWQRAEDCGQQIAGTTMESVENKATLVLADGQTVEIGGEEKVIQDRGSVIKISEGQVLYENIDRAGTTVYNTIKIPRKGVFAMELSDGTKVFLNPGSELRYPLNFDGGTREVTLRGEARFDVKHNPTQPFIVIAGDKTITVLGTSFIVSVYENDPFNTASLLSGTISISNADGSVKRILTPGLQAVWKEGGRGIAVEEFNVEHFRLFGEGVVVLEEKDVRSIMRMLSRWFDVDIEYLGDPSVNHSITVRFSKDNELRDILTQITKVGGPVFKIENSTIYVY